MAVKKTTPALNKPSLGRRFLLSVLMVSFFGWLTLIVWASWLWLSTNFEMALMSVESLGRRQAFVVQEFDDSALLANVRERFIPELEDASRRALSQAAHFDDELTSYIKNQWSRSGDHLSGALRDASLDSWWQDARDSSSKVWLLLKTTGHVLLIKLGILIAAIPLFLMAIVAGLVDGLNQRAIRTASLGRESTYVFHKSIPLARKTMVLVLGFWLALPWVFSPSLMFVSLAVLLSFVMSMTASRFKKYL